MLQPLLSPGELWPRGIPSSIRLHADASLSEVDDVDRTDDDKPHSADEEDDDFSEDAFVREASKRPVPIRTCTYFSLLSFLDDSQKTNLFTIGGMGPDD